MPSKEGKSSASAVARSISAALTQLRRLVSKPATTTAPANVPRKNLRREISPLIDFSFVSFHFKATDGISIGVHHRLQV
jgi:hypothetical protein